MPFIPDFSAFQAPAMQYRSALMWFRRDPRAFDNAALHAALVHASQVHCVFVFDRDIWTLPDRFDRA